MTAQEKMRQERRRERLENSVYEALKGAHPDLLDERVIDTEYSYKLSDKYIDYIKLVKWNYMNREDVRGQSEDETTHQNIKERQRLAATFRHSVGALGSYRDFSRSEKTEASQMQGEAWDITRQMCPNTQEAAADRSLTDDPRDLCGL